MSAALPEIPVIDLEGEGPLALLDREAGRAEEILNAGRKQYGGLVIDLLDLLSRRWARRSGVPFLSDIEAAARRPLPRGLWFMNMAYEWGCTSRAAAEPGGAGIRLLRTLDWPFDSLGRNLVVTRHDTEKGPYYNVTWPGFLGVITALAPGRFAVAINQAPIPKHGPAWLPYPWFLDWLISRARTFFSNRMAPAHLLRLVFEDCASFAEAQKRLAETPVALPVFFTITGTEEGEAVVIERFETSAVVHEDDPVVANHWLTPGQEGKPRGRESRRRLANLAKHDLRADWDFDWLSEPVLNPDTRLALIANAASGELWVQGVESDGPATAVRRIGSRESRAPTAKPFDRRQDDIGAYGQAALGPEPQT